MKMKQKKSNQIEPDWADPPVKRWISTILNSGTLITYKVAFRTFSQYTRLSGTQIIQEATDDWKKPPGERQDVIMTRLIHYYKFLTEEYVGRKGNHMSPNTATCYVEVVRSFYDEMGFPVRMKGRKAPGS